MAAIGKLERVELRELWKHEEYDFSTWLAEEENLALLGDAVGLDISLIERESSVGGYSVDVYAEEQGTGKKIIIENQRFIKAKFIKKMHKLSKRKFITLNLR